MAKAPAKKKPAKMKETSPKEMKSDKKMKEQGKMDMKKDKKMGMC